MRAEISSVEGMLGFDFGVAAEDFRVVEGLRWARELVGETIAEIPRKRASGSFKES